MGEKKEKVDKLKKWIIKNWSRKWDMLFKFLMYSYIFPKLIRYIYRGYTLQQYKGTVK